MEPIYFKPIACFHSQNQTPKINARPIINQDIVEIKHTFYDSQRFARRTFISGNRIEMRVKTRLCNYVLLGEILDNLQVKLYENARSKW